MDFDINMECGEDRSAEVLRYLANSLPDLEISESTFALARNEGQVRIRWGQYKVDLLFANTTFHDAIAERVCRVPFLDREIPIIVEEHLIV